MIELHDLSTGYSRDKPILKNFNYKFENKTYGILGESGCGKTTLLRTIAGLMKPLSGEVIIDGEKVTKANKNNVYMVHQNYTSFDWKTVLQNVLIAKDIKASVTDEDVKNAKAMLKLVGLEGHDSKYPKQLSGGQRQRLALARTLFMKPQIILMDEPLSALDERTRTEMQQLIMKIHNETNNTIVMITHSKEEAEKMCDVIINFNQKGE